MGGKSVLRCSSVSLLLRFSRSLSLSLLGELDSAWAGCEERLEVDGGLNPAIGALGRLRFPSDGRAGNAIDTGSL